MNRVSDRLVLSLGLVVTAVGSLDAFVSREWDLLAVFLLASIVQLVLWLRQRAERTPMSLRPDLAVWIRHRAETTGEPLDDMVDRAVAYYKHGLYADSRDDA